MLSPIVLVLFFFGTAFPFFPLVVFNTSLDFSCTGEQQRKMEQQLCFNLILKLLSKKAFSTIKKKTKKQKKKRPKFFLPLA